MGRPILLSRYLAPVVALLACAACASLHEESPRPAPVEFLSFSGEPDIETLAGQTARVTLRWQQVANQPLDGTTGARAAAAASREPDFRWCLARTDRTGGRDACYDFVTGTVRCALDNAAAIQRQRVCTADANLPTSLAGTGGALYVRSIAPEDPKSYTNSNTRNYSWTVLKPDLLPDDATENIRGDVVQLQVHVLNQGDVDATDVVMRFDEMRVVDANGTAHSLSQADLVYDEVPSGSANTQVIEIDTGTFNLTRPFVLSLRMTVDPENAIDESNESNNWLRWNQQFY
jgi:CARDB